MLSALGTDNSPFSEQQLSSLKLSLGALDKAQSQWLSGYLAGRLESGNSIASVESRATEPALTIIYGSETGNGERLAQKLEDQFKQAGIVVRIESLDRFRPAQLQKLERVVFIISTHGEGDPPEEAIDLFEYLLSDRASQLTSLEFRVLALGDRSYEHFCATGRDLDERLHALGAKSFGARVECDVDYESDSEGWLAEVFSHVKEHWADTPSSVANTRLSLVQSKPRWTRQEPLSAEVLKLQKITAEDSEKDIYHLELDLQDSGFEYRPGDSVGVWAPNDPETVSEIISTLKLDGPGEVNVDESSLPLSEALGDHYEITRLSAGTIEAYAQSAHQPKLFDHFQSLDSGEKQRYLAQRQLVDVVQEYPGEIEAQALVDLLRPLAPRSYSISSAQNLVDDEAHLTVATLQSKSTQTLRNGVASHFLNHRVGVGGQVRIFPEPNRRFHLPEDTKVPIIMIAAGTGIAPFRGFMQESEATGANRESWLIFGNPHLRTDFLYQREWLNWRETGALDRLDTAWSRDGVEKRYVQHVISEQAEQFDQWLQGGAHIYVCGGLAMGHAVNEAIQSVVANQREISLEESGQVLADLRRAGRIHKDLY